MSALARRHDPVTSHIAALNVEACGTASTQREKCLAVVIATPGLTSAEIAQMAGLDRNTAARRLPELREAGKVRNGEKRLCSVNNTPQMTWYLQVQEMKQGELWT
jgi:predicted HTH transcriptional regulator